MAIHLGDFPASHTAVCIPFDSFAASTGAPSATTNFAAADVLIYKDFSTTQRSSASGITVSTSFDSETGWQGIKIDLSDNTDAGFYAAGHEYQVGVADITIDAQTVRFWAGTFSIQRAGGILANVLDLVASIAALSTPTQIADALLDRDMSTGTDSGSTTVRTPRQALRLLRNKASIAGGTLTVKKEDDATTSWTASVTTTAGDPVSAIDPAGP